MRIWSDFDIQRVEAVDGMRPDLRALLENEFRIPRQYHDFGSLTKGEVGCSLSHLRAWRLIAESEMSESEVCVVAEDDCLPFDAKLVKQILEEFHCDTPSNLCFLGYRANNSLGGIIPTLKAVANVIRLPQLSCESFFSTSFALTRLSARFRPKRHGNLERANLQYGTYAYALKKQGARRLIQENLWVEFRSDECIDVAIIKKHINAVRCRKPVVYPNFQIESNLREAPGQRATR